MQQLAPEHIVEDSNGNLWIRKPRQKDERTCATFPCLIFRWRFSANTQSIRLAKKKKQIAASSLQSENEQLSEKKIADLCLINKTLTTHVARHSYATSVCLANGVSIENVAKMLGHTNIKMTQHYARVLDSSILRDMNNVKERDGKSNAIGMERGVITISETGVVTMPTAPVWMTKFEIATCSECSHTIFARRFIPSTRIRNWRKLKRGSISNNRKASVMIFITLK